jgi:RNA polymerase sigma-70 factor (ECF subfamily)
MSDDWITTSTLLHRLRDFRDDAWRTFVLRFRRPVASFAVDLGVPRDDAEDVAQEALLDFARAFREGKYDRDRGRLSAWLFGIAYHRAARLRRRRSREPGIEPEEAAAQVPDERWASTVWDRRWQAHVLAECVRQARREFAPETFRAFDLVVVRGRSPAEAAGELGIPVKAVYNAKHRVLKRVRELGAALESVPEPGDDVHGR